MSEVDDLKSRVTEIFNQTWDTRDGKVVPDTDDVKLAGGAVKFEGVVLYADLKSSSVLSQVSPATTVAKIVRAYLHIMCRLISVHDGSIVSFDGDRVMGIFAAGNKNTNAAKCALKMNYAVTKVLAPAATNNFESIKKANFVVSHAVGIDRSNLLAVRAGQPGSNDLVWIGRAPNMAAKLSEIRAGTYRSFVSGDVYDTMLDEAKIRESDKAPMWEQRTFEFAGQQYMGPDGEGQLLVMSSGASYPSAAMTASITGSYLFTDIYVRWREIELDRKSHSAENTVWAPFAKAIQNTPFRYLNNLRLEHALALREEGRLGSLRGFLAKVWKGARTDDQFESANAILLAEELAEKVRQAEQEWKKIDSDLLKIVGTEAIGGLLAAGPLIAAGHAAFLAAAAAVGGTVPLINSTLRRRSFPDRFPAAFFMKIDATDT